MLKLSSSEREALTGPLVVGCVLGALAGFASWGFDGEYRHLVPWQMGLHAMVAFLASLAVVAIPFGILPIVAGRLRERNTP